MIYKMVQAGVPASVIIQTITAAPRVDFHFLPGDLQEFQSYKVPEGIFEAMAAKAEGLLTPTPASPPPSPPTGVQSPRPTVAARPAAPQSEPDERYLGHVQLGGFAGANLGPDRYEAGVASFSVGAEVRVGIAKYFDVTGTYAFDKIGNGNIGNVNIGNVAVSAHAQEFMGGVRAPFRNRGRITPYLQTSAGGLNLSVSASGYSLGITKFAVAPGGGLDLAVARHLNVGFDVRAIKAFDIPEGFPTALRTWQYRAAAGLFVAF
ncbi:MAG TPA: outer membrane beta-barrel protein [Bryobacteraceae bacterium]